ncbi:MAG TPA: glycoside hydrolase family 2 TIM barrel-domain containing protein, partial [Phototrophicaceae bacterium]|nr:glycoside hydrolase family 2 TIM barrel-domain containing protein [Phototrophicaceae bacterium]
MTFKPSISPYRDNISLNGSWAFALDPHDLGIADQWYLHDLDTAIEVPGSWAERGYGNPPLSHHLAGWNPLLEYEGVAWYINGVEIPPTWENKSVELIIKGARWHTTVWLDDNPIGDHEALSVPHCYDLTPFLHPGSHQRIAIRVDNRMIYALDESHINSEQTATRWGGITGGIELIASPLIAIKTIRCRPDVIRKTFHFDTELSKPVEGILSITLTNPETGEAFNSSASINGSHGQLAVNVGETARLWWDDDPFLYQASIVLKQGDLTLDTLEKRVGLREIAVEGRNILLNGKPIFLRGYVDCCIFPQTGYPVWDIEHYRRQFQIARSYGFNHVRLHSWTAPEPFWDAADEYGMLVQTELPNWTLCYRSSDEEPSEKVHGFLMSELERIVEALNLYPSWVMFSNGNELISPDGHPRLLELIARGKELDPTRLYTDNTGFGQIPVPDRAVDFYIQSCNWHPPKKIYDAASNDTTEDFNAITAQTDRPLIGHEHGQFTMYVRPAEAEKYTGALRPSWLESIQETFESKSLTGQIDDYIYASGIHMVRAYKENIERARRTRDLAGLQLLDIRDFPGQGHATTGILDMFWDSKGLIKPELFAQFNGEVVLLMRTASPTFWNNTPMVV